MLFKSVSKLILLNIIMAWVAMPYVHAQSSLALEEIIVTAQKRAESLSDVPISVSAISGQKIQDGGIEDLSDLSEFVPGVHISRGAVNTTINIRGIGSGNNRSFEQSVAMYVDGIYMGRGRQYRSPFLDIERVEVLRGPQGILFGKNAIAGAINITSKSPTVGDELNGFITARLEPEDETTDISAAVTIPLSDNFAMRLAGGVSKSDGYITNQVDGNSAFQPEDQLARATLVWNASEKLDATLKLSHAEFETSGSALTPKEFSIIDDPKAPLDTVAFAFVGIAQPNFSNADPHDGYIDIGSPIGRNGPEGTDTSTDNLGLTLNYQLDNEFTLTSVTGYSEYDAIDSQDVDFLPIRFISRFDDRQFDQFSQEFRIASPGDQKVDFIAGVYYETQDLQIDGQVGIDSSFGGLTNSVLGIPSLFLPLLGPLYELLPTVEISRNNFYALDTESFAAFGELTYNINDELRVAVGARFSSEEKKVNKSLSLSSDVTGGLSQPSSNPILAALWNGAFNTVAHNLSDERKTDHFDPSIKVSWDYSDQGMAYASYSQGFKSGGFNSSDDLPIDADGNAINFEYNDEEAQALEVGIKTDLAGGAARLNVAAFLTKYDDLQVATFQGTNFTVSNAAEAEIKGVEVDLTWRVTEALTLAGAVAYLDFEFDRYDTAGCTSAQIAAVPVGGPVCVQDLSGRTNAYAPEWSGNFNANYITDISDSLVLNIDLDANFKSEMFLDFDLDPLSEQGSFVKINARIAIENADNTWSLAAFGHNLTDEITFGYSVDTPLVTGSQSAVPTDGRVFGIEVGYRF